MPPIERLRQILALERPGLPSGSPFRSEYPADWREINDATCEAAGHRLRA
jgi:hypothetical protein